jgi:glutathione S-transferase
MHEDSEADDINGRGKTWSLPLAPLSATSMPEPYAPGDNPPVDTTRASARLIRNHEAVARFAARQLGPQGAEPGFVPNMPSAAPDEATVGHTDAALRHVAHALLVGVDEKQAGKHPLKVCP